MEGNGQKKIKQGKPIVFYLKVFFTIILCAFILWKGDWGIIWEKLRTLKLWLIPVVFFCYILAQAISAFKWQIVLSVHDIHFKFGELHRYYYTAMFFNNFLPTSIGGDSYRVYKTISNPKSKSGAIIAILGERISGIIALISLGFIGGLVHYVQFGDDLSLAVITCGAVAISLIPLVFFVALIKNRVTGLHHKRIFPQWIKIIIQSIGDYKRQMGKTIAIIGISFFFSFTFTFPLPHLGRYCG